MSSDKLPNFLIVGAARCGTTSLYNYLIQHPEIFMSVVKEPQFITAQFLKFPHTGKGDKIVDTNRVKDFEQYRGLFISGYKEKAIGEASADILYYYSRSISIIKEILGEAKIIIVLRNPVNRAFSNYMYLTKDGNETLEFEESLQTENERIASNFSYIWHYQKIGFYFQQVKAFIESFENVAVYLYDDLQTNANELLFRIFNFLEVDNSYKPKSKITYNASGVPKNKYVYDFLTKSNPLKQMIKPIADKLFPIEKRSHFIERAKTKLLDKEAMNIGTKQYLEELYRDDILELQELLRIDLKAWI